MKVLIEKCSVPSGWMCYHGLIGETIEVDDYDAVAYVDKTTPRTKILKTDCSIVSVPSPQDGLKWDTIKHKDYVVECLSREELKSVMALSWCDEIPTHYDADDSGWHYYSLKMPRSFGNMEYFESLGYTIIPADQFIKANTEAASQGEAQKEEKRLETLIDEVDDAMDNAPTKKFVQSKPAEVGAMDVANKWVFELLEQTDENNASKLAADISALVSSEKVKAMGKQGEFAIWAAENSWIYIIRERRWYNDGKYVTTSDLIALFITNKTQQ